MLNAKSFPKDLINIISVIKNACLPMPTGRQAAGRAGFKCYIVGGGIRDLLLGRKPGLWDLATDATPDQVIRLFKKVIPTGIEFGTVTVLENNVPYEITTFRSDQRYADGRHPSNVTFSRDLKADLSRRDFTINAIAYDPITGELVDEYGGRKDLKKKTIRTVGDPLERFSEDGLRPLRACRFAAILGFDIEKKTLEAIPKCLETAKKVSMERVHDELMKMLEADRPSIGIHLMKRSGLLSIYIPELEAGVGIEQPKPFHKDDVYWHDLHTCDEVSRQKPVLRLAALLHDVAKPQCKVDMTFYDHDNIGTEMAFNIMKRLKFSNEHIEYVASIIRNHMFNYTSEWSGAAIRRFIRRVGITRLDDLFELRRADVKAMGRSVEEGHPRELRRRIKKIIDDQNALHIKDLKVDGNDVMKELNIGPGPRVGEILEALLEKVLDNPELNTKAKLIELIKEYI
jgi:poly(A) polymerase/tRNA nucleotidyltransferase (CCA-adding enzyme)